MASLYCSLASRAFAISILASASSGDEVYFLAQGSKQVDLIGTALYARDHRLLESSIVRGRPRKVKDFGVHLVGFRIILVHVSAVCTAQVGILFKGWRIDLRSGHQLIKEIPQPAYSSPFL